MINQRLAFVLLVSVLLLLNPKEFLIDNPSAAQAEILRSTLLGLDLAKVYLFVETEYQYDERLRNRAISRFATKKLLFNTSTAYKEGDPLLRVTVNWREIDGAGLKKGLYYRKIELAENVVSERTPRIRAWAITASYGLPEPIVSDRPTIEQLERDLDSLIDGFIQDYSYANGKRD